jgi:hypothetical protein|tara:strand:+ start:297 stop:1076 length:780 start_codon:yes stop_codon:yes gene_type:complete
MVTTKKLGRPAATKSANPQCERGEDGLLKNVEHKFQKDGFIDWRAMIKPEHLFPNKSYFEMYDKPMPQSIEGLSDNKLLIKLGGIKELARLRGFTSVKYQFVKCELDHVAASCSINFIGNYETGGEGVVFEDAANATLSNTSSFATKFLETIACNRAFVRCVRNFLNIHIVGVDEIDSSSKQETTAQQTPSKVTDISPTSILASHAREKLGCNGFDEFKDILRELWKSNRYKNDDIQSWNTFDDIPAKEARILLAHINS